MTDPCFITTSVGFTPFQSRAASASGIWDIGRNRPLEAFGTDSYSSTSGGASGRHPGGTNPAAGERSGDPGRPAGVVGSPIGPVPEIGRRSLDSRRDAWSDTQKSSGRKWVIIRDCSKGTGWWRKLPGLGPGRSVGMRCARRCKARKGKRKGPGIGASWDRSGPPDPRPYPFDSATSDDPARRWVFASSWRAFRLWRDRSSEPPDAVVRRPRRRSRFLRYSVHNCASRHRG